MLTRVPDAGRHRRARQVARDLHVGCTAAVAHLAGAGALGVNAGGCARDTVAHQRAFDGPIARHRGQQVHLGRAHLDAIPAGVAVFVVAVAHRYRGILWRCFSHGGAGQATGQGGQTRQQQRSERDG